MKHKNPENPTENWTNEQIKQNRENKISKTTGKLTKCQLGLRPISEHPRRRLASLDYLFAAGAERRGC